MSDISVTAANVKVSGSTARLEIVQVGETVTAGQSLYLKSSDGKYWKADANASAEAAGSNRLVVCLVGAAADAYAVVVVTGPMIPGATLTNGQAYIVSTTAGGIAPVSDFSGYSGAFQHHIGYAISTTVLDVQPRLTGASN